MTGRFPIEESQIYQLIRMEKQEIDKLKWIESEKAGHDIGFHKALIIWTVNHKSIWLKEMKSGIATGINFNIPA